jgi:large subunit ribosomal protein L5
MEQELVKQNPMREIKIEKVVVSIGGVGEALEKGIKLIEMITGRKAARMISTKRIPAFSVRPGLEVGTVVTLRKNKEEFLNRFLAAIENKLKTKQISENNFSFGVPEYIEIPGVEYQREIGIIGLDVTVVFKRTGKRVGLKKVKKGKVSKKQIISREEIIKFMEENFQTSFE